MTISVWRFSHLALAVSSFLFITLASLTGFILAFEPISQKMESYQSSNFNQITVGQMVTSLTKNNDEIISISVDNNHFVIVKAIAKDGKSVEFYASPDSGKFLANTEKENVFFQWITTLHRSLFLHEVGRIVMGIASFFLFLIAISGTILLLQRQRGFKNFFATIIKENFAQYYHVVLGRLSLIPIVIIALSGTYLSLEKFAFFKEQKIAHTIDFDAMQSEPKIKWSDFAVFKNTPLSEVQNIEFPFSDDVEDYFTLKLKNQELFVNQFTGEILSTIPYSKTTIFSTLSLDLHTGRASALWAILLAIVAINILFFVYSGFAMTLQRIKNKVKNKYKKEDCNFIVLVGSENGSTFHFANAVHQQLLKNGQKSFITELNNFTVFPKAEHILFATATYGLGDAPTNASKFIKLLNAHPQQNQVYFSVLAFGSKSYPEFCKFGHELHNRVLQQDWAQPFLEIHTVNDKSPADFQKWFSLWSQKLKIPLENETEIVFSKSRKRQLFKVTKKTKIAYEEGAFLMQLENTNKSKFTSGDLLSVFPANDYRERLYSMGKVNNKIQLSVKLHSNGLGSNYLYNLEIGTTIKAIIVSNKKFHFPKKAKKVVMISNGTGIAPFLGMIDQNNSEVSCHLYCGFRGNASYELYQKELEKNLENRKLASLNVAFSREGEKRYVKDLIPRDAPFIAATLKEKGVVLICGSVAMQQMVLEKLEIICAQNNLHELSFYQSRNQLRMDCY